MTDIDSSRDVGLFKAELAADKCGDEWKAFALEAFKNYALSHNVFTTEDVRLKNENIKTNGDPRAWGHIAQSAKRSGIVEFYSYTPVSSSNGSAKVLWRSLIIAQNASNGGIERDDRKD